MASKQDVPDSTTTSKQVLVTQDPPTGQIQPQPESTTEPQPERQPDEPQPEPSTEPQPDSTQPDDDQDLPESAATGATFNPVVQAPDDAGISQSSEAHSCSGASGAEKPDEAYTHFRNRGYKSESHLAPPTVHLLAKTRRPPTLTGFGVEYDMQKRREEWDEEDRQRSLEMPGCPVGHLKETYRKMEHLASLSEENLRALEAFGVITKEMCQDAMGNKKKDK